MSYIRSLSFALLTFFAATTNAQVRLLPGAPTPGETDALTALRSIHFHGSAGGDNFATSAAIAGDLNGDGYADVIVGAPMNDAAGADAGRAYIFFGGPRMTTTPNLILSGGASTDYFGFSVAGAGDVNADGYADVIVGAPFNDAGGTSSGAAYVYFGGPTMNNSSDILLSGEAAGDEFGKSVASAGDFNGDGYDDVIVGAWRADGTGSDNGKSYLYYGGSFPEGVVDRTFTGSNPGDLFGVAVTGVGDMDNDGYDDVAIGAEGTMGGSPISGSNAGRVVIYFGDSGGLIHRQLAIPGTAAYDNFGHSVAGAGDVNGDGYADLIVGAYGNDLGGTDAGRAVIYHGGSYVDGIADLYLSGKTPGEYAGISVASVGDLNGDGYSDVIVGAHLNDVGANNGGQARVYCGGARMDVIPDTWLTGIEAGEVLGYCVAGGGDVDGDGYDDYCAGAYRNDAHGVDAGRLYLCFNALTGPDQPDMAFYGLASEHFGGLVQGIGDVNGDSYGDFAVYASTTRYTPGLEGTVFVYYGGAVLDTVPDAILHEAGVGNFGLAIAGGDLNGDGLSDLALGAYGAGSTGRVYIYLSKPGFTNVPDQILEGSDANEHFGFALASGGDVNGDGYEDLAISSRDYDNDAGSVSLALGGQGGIVSWQRLTWGNSSSGDRLGTSLAMGDFNGDGQADICAGAPAYDTARYDYLRVILGGQGDLNSFDILDMAHGTYFGGSLTSPGDFNGDGYDDILAVRYSREDGWAAHLYAGGIILAMTPVLVLQPATMRYYEPILAGAGDANGDGYADIAMGSGRGADIYFGGRSPDAVPDIRLWSDEIQEDQKTAVDFVGDVNGDGIDDAILGTPYVHHRASNGGAAYLFLSSSPAIVPRILSAADVPADQGGRVLLTWTRSGYDALGVSRVTSYVIERSLPPGKSGFAWEPIGSIQAGHNPRYAFAAPTLNDSSANASGTLFFRVTAATNNPNEYWRSMAVSARSVDNLAPPAPGPLGGSMTGETALLHWRPSAAEDLFGYELFRSTSPGFDPDTLLPIATLADTAFADAAFPAAPTLYYAVRAIDVHGNRSGPSNELSLGAVGIAEDGSPLPATFVLEQNYPNPFNPTTIFRYGVPERAEVSLILYNMLGEEIAVLVRDVVEAGYHEVRLNAAHLPTGIYFCIMKGGGVKSTRKVALIR